MEITNLLETFEFPEFSLAELNPKVNAVTILALYGHYCISNRIKFKDVQNKNNKGLHFISKNAGRMVSLEIRNNEIVERIRLRYNRFFDGYEPVSPEPYELLFREVGHPSSV